MVKPAEEVEDHLDEQAQALHSPVGRGGKFACYRLLKLLSDDRIQQRILVGKVSIKGSSIDGRPLRDVLDTDRGKAFLLEEFQKSLLQKLAGPLDTRVHAFGCDHHESPFVSYLVARNRRDDPHKPDFPNTFPSLLPTHWNTAIASH